MILRRSVDEVVVYKGNLRNVTVSESMSGAEGGPHGERNEHHEVVVRIMISRDEHPNRVFGDRTRR